MVCSVLVLVLEMLHYSEIMEAFSIGTIFDSISLSVREFVMQFGS